jgi:hypothetical protein
MRPPATLDRLARWALAAMLAVAPARAAEFLTFIPTTGSSREVQIVGDVAYVADGAGGLRIYDISDPSQPDAIGDVPPLPGGSARSVDVVGTRAYVANDGPGVQIIDVTDPSAPAPLGSFDPAGSTPIARAAGDFAYAASTSSVSVWNVANPAAPVPRGSLPTPLFASMRIANGHLVVTGATAPTFRVIDVSNPDAPAQVGSVPDARGAIGVDGSSVWLVDDAEVPATLFGIDVSNPAAPDVFARATSPDPFAQVSGAPAVFGRLLFSDGLLVANVHGAGSPQPPLLDSIDLPHAAEDVEISDNQVYVTTQDPSGPDQGGLEIIDYTDPEALFFAITPGVSLGDSWGLDVVKIGTTRTAYVASDDALAIVDVSSPAAPVVRSQPGLGARILDVDADGTTAAVLGTRVGATCELITVDASSPSAPVERDRMGFTGSPGTVVVANGIAYVACEFSDAVHIVDLADPGNLVEIETLITGEDPHVARDGDFLYVATSTAIASYNVADPANPIFLGSLDVSNGFGSALRIHAVNRRVYVPPLRIFQFSNPVEPGLANERVVPDASAARSIRWLGQRVFVPTWRPDFTGRLSIYDAEDIGELEIDPISTEGFVGLSTSISVNLATGIAASSSGALGVQIFDASADIAASPCIDGVDNDGDGFVDMDSDPGCSEPRDDSERPACLDGLDNDGDGLTDNPADPGCKFTLAVREDPQCQDGVDNDGDGDVDFPADSLCTEVPDNDELGNRDDCGLLGIEPLVALAALRLRRRYSASTRSRPSNAGV